MLFLSVANQTARRYSSLVMPGQGRKSQPLKKNCLMKTQRVTTLCVSWAEVRANWLAAGSLEELEAV